MSSQTRVIKKVDRTKQLAAAVKRLTDGRVGVGWPRSSAGRDEGELNNPTLGYIHEHGAPERNLPARPALSLGLKAAQGKINTRLKRAAELVLEGRSVEAEIQLGRLGTEVADAVRAAITAGIPPPLADSTLRGRIRQRRSGRAGERTELAVRKAGYAPGVQFAKPLFFSGQLAHAVSYVILNGFSRGGGRGGA